jgi:ethanolamine ammonia-lyase large subunit
MTLADLAPGRVPRHLLIPYESDEVTRLIVDNLDVAAFANVANLTVGEFRDWLLGEQATPETLAALAPGLMPEMAAAVSKIMRLQDLIAVAAKIRVVTRFRTTVGLPGRLSTRLQPNHPTDDPAGIAASILDGLSLSSGDAVIGINPVSDSVETVTTLLRLIDRIRTTLQLPVQSCVLAHITTRWRPCAAARRSISSFQSIAGTEAANASFGVNLSLAERGLAGGARTQSAANAATTSCISKPARAARSRPMRITASISRPARPAPTPSRATSSRCWSTP